MTIKSIIIETHDGYHLAGSEFVPEHTNGIGVIINGATGVLRRYYQAYAEFLCQQGFTVLSYEFRGIGESQPVHSDAPTPSMLHWGQRDMDAVLTDFIQRHPLLTVKGIGHSVGGQLLGVLPDNNRYCGFLNIASQHIYWKHWPMKDRPLTVVFFFGVLPLFYTLTGGLPKWVLGAEYLPRQVARDWSRFGRKKAYIADPDGRPLRKGFQEFTGKMRFYGMADDRRFAPPSAVYQLEKLFSNADSHVKILDPRDYQMKSIDHFGFFKKSMNRQAWQENAEWLLG
ncbi:serine aminopeptidase domain-containing protein [Endozoicomonas sp. SESOKO1]|uniref:alpha/beta hydrolase family protein n=1 Tax=Endozoicomonas sp. SESOKO1 TaxID=2828742 RepID=UPI002149699A|nr:alpha/beta hydrolase [Endozoicomonas sp. SESOKO1]